MTALPEFAPFSAHRQNWQSFPCCSFCTFHSRAPYLRNQRHWTAFRLDRTAIRRWIRVVRISENRQIQTWAESVVKDWVSLCVESPQLKRPKSFMELCTGWVGICHVRRQHKPVVEAGLEHRGPLRHSKDTGKRQLRRRGQGVRQRQERNCAAFTLSSPVGGNKEDRLLVCGYSGHEARITRDLYTTALPLPVHCGAEGHFRLLQL